VSVILKEKGLGNFTRIQCRIKVARGP